MCLRRRLRRLRLGALHGPDRPDHVQGQRVPAGSSRTAGKHERGNAVSFADLDDAPLDLLPVVLQRDGRARAAVGADGDLLVVVAVEAPLVRLLDERVVSVRESFMEADENGDGLLSVGELQRALARCGANVSAEEVEALVRRCDFVSGEAPTIDLDGFTQVVRLLREGGLEDGCVAIEGQP